MLLRTRGEWDKQSESYIYSCFAEWSIREQGGRSEPITEGVMTTFIVRLAPILAYPIPRRMPRL